MIRYIFLFTFVITSFNIEARTELKPGDTLPNYLGKDSHGKDVNLDDYKGRIVILSFWASWCSYCMKELPVLENIQNKAGEDRVKVIAINFKESKKTFRKILKSFSSLNLTLAHDAFGSIGSRYGVRQVPNLFIVNTEGELIFHRVGYGKSTIDEILKVLNQQFQINGTR